MAILIFSGAYSWMGMSWWMAAAMATPCAPELEHRLHVLAEEWRLDGHLVGQKFVDDARHAFEDSAQLEVWIVQRAQVDDTHCHHARLRVQHAQDAIAHDIGARVDAENDALLVHLGRFVGLLPDGL